MRGVLFVGLLLLAVCPAEAQEREKRDQYEITAEELKEYGQATLAEAIPHARPNFFTLPGASRGEQVITACLRRCSSMSDHRRTETPRRCDTTKQAMSKEYVSLSPAICDRRTRLALHT
jgi:hypothetical protein